MLLIKQALKLRKNTKTYQVCIVGFIAYNFTTVEIKQTTFGKPKVNKYKDL